jgi:hypothetical protein
VPCPPYHGHYRPQPPPVVPGPSISQSPPLQYYPSAQQYGHPPAQPTSGLAVTSLVFGLIGFFGGFCLFGVPCAIAVLLGHLAIRETGSGERGGHGMAIAGLILGYLFILPAIIVIAMGGAGAVLGSVSPSVTPSP